MTEKVLEMGRKRFGKGEIARYEQFLVFPMGFNPFPKRQILDFIKLKEFADDNFKFDENGRKFSSRKYCGKRRNCSLRASFPISIVFSKYLNCILQTRKTKGLYGKGLIYQKITQKECICFFSNTILEAVN